VRSACALAGVGTLPCALSVDMFACWPTVTVAAARNGFSARAACFWA
jgi:hypothetical protein